MTQLNFIILNFSSARLPIKSKASYNIEEKFAALLEEDTVTSVISLLACKI